MALVSVIMPSYNHGQFIGCAIRSILNQTFSDLELIIVDDGSKDESNEVIQDIEDPRIVHIPLRYNIGACAAMNMAIRRSKGEFIAVCNSDDWWLPHKLELQLGVLQSLPETGAVFSDVFWIDDKGQDLENSERPAFSTIFREINRSRFAWLRRLVENGNCLCHPSVLVRRGVYKKVGLYNNLLRQ